MATKAEQILLQVKTDNSQAIIENAKLAKQIDELKAKNKELANSNKSLEEAQKLVASTAGKESEQYKKLSDEIDKNSQDIEVNKINIGQLNNAYRQNTNELSANIKMQNEHEGSLRQMQAQLSALNLEYSQLSESERKNEEIGGKLQKRIKGLSDAYKEEQMAVGNTYVNVGNYGEVAVKLSGNLEDLQKQIKEVVKGQIEASTQAKNLTSQMTLTAQAVGKESEEYRIQAAELERLTKLQEDSKLALKDLVSAAGQVKDAIDDTNASINYMAADTNALNSAIQATQFGVSVFTAYQSVITSLGVSSKSYEQTMKSLTSTIAFLNAAQQIQNALQKQSALMMGVSRVQALALSTANKLQESSWIGAGTAMKAFNAIAKANPLILIGAALAAVVIGIVAFTSSTKDATEATKVFNEIEQNQLDLIQLQIKYRKEQQSETEKVISHQIEMMKLQGYSIDDIQFKEQMLAKNRLRNAEQNLRDNKKYVDDLGKNKKQQLELNDLLTSYNNEKARGSKIALFEGKKTDIQDAIDAVQSQINTLGKKIQIGAEVQVDYDSAKRAAELLNLQQEKNNKERAKNASTLFKDNEKKIRDIGIQLLKEGLEKEKALLKAKLDDDLKSVKGNEQQKAKLRELINQKYQQDLKKLEEANLESRYQKAIETQKAEISARLDLVTKGSKEEFQLRLEAFDLEKDEAIKSAIEKNIAVDLIEAQYAQKRIAIIQAQAATEREQRKTELAKIANDKAIELETELLKLGENEYAKNELILEFEQARLAEILNMDTAAKEELGLNEIEYANLVEQQQARIRAATEAQMNLQKAQIEEGVELLKGFAGSMKELFTTIAEDNEAMAGFSKAMAAFQIAIDTAMSISASIAGAAAAAAAGGPAAPFILAGYIAAMIGTIVSAVAQAKKLLGGANEPTAPKFSTGGVYNDSGSGGTVKGSGTGTSDSINAHLSNGESVMTALTTRMFTPLLSSLNQIGGGVPITLQQSSSQIEGEEMLTRAFIRGVALLPNPIVSVTDVNNVNGRVQAVEINRNS